MRLRVGLLLAALVAPAPALAIGPKLDRATIGFLAQVGPDTVLVGGVSGIDAWLPCEVVLTHPGTRTVNGSLVLVEGHPPYASVARRTVSYRRPVSLDPGATKRLRFPVLYDPAMTYALVFEEEGGGRTVLASSVQASAPSLLRTPLELPPTQPLILVARRREQGTGVLAHLEPKPPVNQLTRTREWTVAEVPPASLPDEGLLYHRVAALILDDLPLAQLDQRQQEAILAFVARGGQLWVSAVTRAEIDDGPLGQALPGQPGKVVSLGDLAAVEAITGQPCVLPTRRSVRTFTPRAGAVAWTPARTVLHRDYDQGRIVLAGYRITDPTVKGGRATLRSLLKTRRSPRLALPGSYGGPLLRLFQAALRRTTRKEVPSLGLIVTLLGVYLVLASVVPFLIARRSGRLERAWVAVAVLALGGAGGVALLGEQYAHETQAIRLSLVEGGRLAGPRQQVSLWALFSEDGGQLPLTFAHDRVAAFPYEQSSPRRLIAGAGRAEVATHPQDTTLLVTTEPIQLPGGLRFRVSGPRPRLDNEGRVELVAAAAWGTDGEPLSLDLPRGLVPLDAQERQVFSASLEAAQQLARTLAQNRKRPLLLWIARQERLSDLPERGLTLGFLEAEDRRLASRGRYECLARLLRDDLQSSTRDWELSAVIAPHQRLTAVELEWHRTSPYYGWRRRRFRGRWRRGQPRRPTPKPQVFDRRGGSWLPDSVRSHARPAAQVAHRDPLGFVRIRVRLQGPLVFEPRARLVTRSKP